MSSQVSQPSQFSHISRNCSENKLDRHEALSNNQSSIPEEESFGHPGSFKNLNEPFQN